MMSSIIRLYRTVVRRYPITVQSLQAGVLMGSCDVTSQLVIEKLSLEQFDWKRSARFFLFASCVGSHTLRVWFRFLDARYSGHGTRGLVKKLLVDQGMFAPSFLVVFLCFLGVLQGNNPQQIRDKIQRDFWDIIKTGWMVWPAFQVCNFTLVPLHNQVIAVQIFAFFWNTYLAWRINRDHSNDKIKQINEQQ